MGIVLLTGLSAVLPRRRLRIVLGCGVGVICGVSLGVELSARADVVLWLGRDCGRRDVGPRCRAAFNKGCIAAHELFTLSLVVESVIHITPLALEGNARV